MGKCHSTMSYPQPGFTLQQLTDVQIGQRQDYPQGCTASVGGSQGGSGYDYCLRRGFNFPRNGEFDFALGAVCSMCSDVGAGYGCECGGAVGGGESIGGQRCAVVRTQFLAPPIECCIQTTGVSIIGDKTCDPRYRGPETPACKELLRGYCDNKDNFFSPVCREYVGNLEGQLKNNLAIKYCTKEAMTTPEKQEWCACYTAESPASFANDPVLQSLFLCLDPVCQGGKNPKTLKPYGLVCPTSLVQCKQEVAIELIKSGIDKTVIQNQCGNINLNPNTDSGSKDNGGILSSKNIECI